jgi:hypothetical protein
MKIKYHYGACRGGPDCNCDGELGMDSLKVGSIIRYWTERLMVEHIDWDKEVLWASCAMGKEFEVPFGEFDIIR